MGQCVLAALNRGPHRWSEVAELEPVRKRPDQRRYAVELDRPRFQRLTDGDPPEPHPIEDPGVCGHQEVVVEARMLQAERDIG